MSAVTYRSCLDKLYEAPAAEEGWAAFLDALCERLGARFAQYIGWDEQTDAIVSCEASNAIALDKKRAYTERYGAIDPRRKLVAARAKNEWLLCHEHFDERYVAQSEFYRDFLVPAGGGYGAIAKLGKAEGITLALAVCRSQDSTPFGTVERAWLKRLTVHLRRAARLHMLLRRLHERGTLAERALDALQQAMIVVDAKARIRATNTAGDDWLRDNGLLANGAGLLRCSQGWLNGALCKALEEATRAGAHGCKALMIPRKPAQKGKGQPFSVLVVPLRMEAHADARSAPGGLALIVAVDPDAGAPLQPDTLQTLFRLTAAEARLAVALASGKCLDQIAGHANVSLHTVRAQLQNVLEKTGARRQAELIKLVCCHPRIEGA